MLNYGLKDQVVLITRTNNPKGIGATMALSFAEQGAKVAMVYKKMNFEYKEELAVGDSLDAYYKALSMDCSENVWHFEIHYGLSQIQRRMSLLLYSYIAKKS